MSKDLELDCGSGLDDDGNMPWEPGYGVWDDKLKEDAEKEEEKEKEPKTKYPYHYGKVRKYLQDIKKKEPRCC